MIKRFVLLLLSVTFTTALLAQDFQCQVSINSQKIAGSNYERYRDLQQELYKFVHERKWCQYNLKMNERIECAIVITLESQAGDKLNATVMLQLQRPVYKTNYKTSLLNFQDKNVQFTYIDGEPLEYVENNNTNQLTSLIAFYLNFFLGVEFDTFAMGGGSPYFDKAQNIVNLCQTGVEPGWKPFESGQANRYWLMENLTNTSYSKFHDFFYQYHRLGLDVMSESPDAGRAEIMESLRLLQQVNQQRSGLFMMQIIVQTKALEIIEIFKEGTAGEKTQVVAIMKQLDPANASRYDAITQSSGPK
ncbi:MAG TPA: DUF4835 family protein [Bacteroidales bacterium]|nr:DUF4835 family protein [Bacteroidales bacterium]HOH22860.1 DUF4835 family protein [Bacteroidales bacterium]HPB57686.1 DUF4835 family protein [Bacteroidales bacterium]HPZ03979.1 DUF4835 family protein [Bacteroidales bacterium]HQB75602.1 DUF4835 family protein [Bacteroidales bacterium]